MKSILSFLFMLMSFSVFAQNPVELPLWPDGAPNSNELTGEEQELQPRRISNVTRPTITVYRPARPNGIAVIMCPGGGYTRLAIDHEGHDMASWFCDQGITYVVLKYRLPNGHWEVPLSDAEQAIRMVRRHAGEWKISVNKVGIMGASAGGHLASTLATHYSSPETRPDFQILLYPVITMQSEYTHHGSREQLIGKTSSAELADRFSNEKRVTPDTPQAFITLSSDDRAVPPANGTNYYLQLVKNGVPATLHAYPTGGHGWGFRDSFRYKSQWTEELKKWLKEGVTFSDTALTPLTAYGKLYLGCPYTAHTLEKGKEEKLIIECDRVDCTTFIEYVSAHALSDRRNESFADLLQRIRYRDGRIDGYVSRLHYTSDWIDNGIRHGFLEDITAAHSPYTQALSLSYMSSHPRAYEALKNSAEMRQKIKECEKALTGKKVHWLPKEQLPPEGLPYIDEGDILAITTSLSGLDVAHVGLATYVNGQLHLLHASSSKGKVVISDTPLRHMLDSNSTWTGLRVLRLAISNPQ